ncbi:MAG: DNA methyltransferase [Armatimonadota bacterium]
MNHAIHFADSRNMMELPEGSIHLVITSPPYWHIKDYGCEGQIGYGQSLHEYLIDISRVWRECYRVLQPGRRLCINIGDQFARSVVYGRYKVVPLHAEVIAQCETIGFDYMGAIIWQKKTTLNTTGGAVVMGSFPYPPNGIVELDYEFILLFRKPGKSHPAPSELKRASALSRDEWKEYFRGHWSFGGARQVGHEAMFPEELPRRLIRMFSFVGETVLDPFLGSGTTAKVAIELGRQAVGYEIRREFEPLIREKLGTIGQASFEVPILFVHRQQPLPPVDPPAGYLPRVQDARPHARFERRSEPTVRVTAVIDEHTLQIENGRLVRLSGVVVPPERRDEAIEYLRRYLQGKRVVIKSDAGSWEDERVVDAYVYLSNRLFVNRKMIEMGLAQPER